VTVSFAAVVIILVVVVVVEIGDCVAVVAAVGDCVVVLLVTVFTAAKEMATRAHSTPTEKYVRATILAAGELHWNGALLCCDPCI